jgi:hypothetical protein
MLHPLLTMQLLHRTSAGFFKSGVLMDKYSQQTMHSPQSLPATSEKYVSELGIDGISQHSSLIGTNVEKMGKYQQQFFAGLLTLPEARDMSDGTDSDFVCNVTSNLR